MSYADPFLIEFRSMPVQGHGLPLELVSSSVVVHLFFRSWCQLLLIKLYQVYGHSERKSFKLGSLNLTKFKKLPCFTNGLLADGGFWVVFIKPPAFLGLIFSLFFNSPHHSKAKPFQNRSLKMFRLWTGSDFECLVFEFTKNNLFTNKWQLLKYSWLETCLEVELLELDPSILWLDYYSA